jgi:hypothetical protein
MRLPYHMVKMLTARRPTALALGFVVLAAFTIKSLGCGGASLTDIPEGRACSCTQDSECLIAPNHYVPGARCDMDTKTCVCVHPDWVPCCDSAEYNECDLNCRDPADCARFIPFCGGSTSSTGAGGAGGEGSASSSTSGEGGATTGAGGAGGDGGTTSVECTSAADCLQPADHRCGKATCEEGKCGLDLIAKPGEFVPVASQLQGDCEVIVCDATGYSIILEDSDNAYQDANPCTLNTCKEGKAVNELVPNGVPCPGIGFGFCLDGACVECISWMPEANDCGGPTVACDSIWCVPQACVDPIQPAPCGDLCAPCDLGTGCDQHYDCKSGSCMNGMCSVPTCDDGLQNDGETGIDCGGDSDQCSACPDGQGCAFPKDCVSQVCWYGECQVPTCTDGVQNADETNIDCGGPCPPCVQP